MANNFSLPNGKLVASSVKDALSASEPHSVFAIVATGGTTNFGIVDDLRGIGEIAKTNNIWYHIDGAYGLAGILSPKYRHLFDGSELADSFIVDPHKWLFAPYDACALVYRNPELARETHTQHASYLETLHDDSWSPSDYAIHLTRRVRLAILVLTSSPRHKRLYRSSRRRYSPGQRIRQTN